MSESREQTCASCGRTSPTDARFCRECGAILAEPGAESIRYADPSASAPPSPEIPTPPPSETRRMWWIVALAAAVLLAWLVHHRQRGNAEIPVPGVASPPTTPAGGGVAARPSPAVSASTPGTRRATAPPAAEATTPPTVEPTPRPTRPHEVDEGARVLRPGWYRMRFRAPLFREANETAPVVTYLPEGTRIRVTRVLPGFLAVESVSGKAPGYVSSDDASPEEGSIR